MKLLHVDRDQNFVHGFQNDFLAGGGMLSTLSSAANISEARQQLEGTNYEAILVDPWSLGDDIAADISELRDAAPDTPLLALTDINDDYRAIEAVASGVSDYLIKTESEPDWLVRRVRYAIERAQRKTRTQAVSKPFMARRWKSTVASVLGRSVSELNQHGRIHAGGMFEGNGNSSIAPNAIEGMTFRMLHVEDDLSFQRLVSKMLEPATGLKFRLDKSSSLGSALQMLRDEPFDVVMLDLSLPDCSGLETLSEVLQVVGDTPVVVLTGRDDDAMAIEGMSLGAEDYLTKTKTNLHFCRRAAQLAVTRRRRLTLESLPDENDQESGSPGDESQVIHHSERRQHGRYLLTKPIFAIPVMPDGSPAEAYSADGFSVDVSAGGIQFEIAGIDRLPTRQILVGIEANDSVLHFASVEARRIESIEQGLRIGAEFSVGNRDLIRRENIEPTFNPATCRFDVDLPVETIAKWVEFGILRATLMDRILICPQCQAVPTFRNGCRICGSVRLHSRPLIHHFACAHIGYVSDFEQDGGVICPKCRTRDLIVGADYEHLSGPYRCLDCDWSDTDLELVGNCLKCEFRFPMNQALEEDLVGYHVHRLDALALINGD